MGRHPADLDQPGTIYDFCFLPWRGQLVWQLLAHPGYLTRVMVNDSSSVEKETLSISLRILNKIVPINAAISGERYNAALKEHELGGE